MALASIAWAACEAGADRFEHRRVRIAFGAMKRPVAERGGDGVGVVAEDDDHVVANRANGIVRGGDERLGDRRRSATARAASCRPFVGRGRRRESRRCGEWHGKSPSRRHLPVRRSLLAADIRLRDRLGRG